jgi:hypothetical protein
MVAGDVRTEDVVSIVDTVAREAPTTADRVQTVISSVFLLGGRERIRGTGADLRLILHGLFWMSRHRRDRVSRSFGSHAHRRRTRSASVEGAGHARFWQGRCDRCGVGTARSTVSMPAGREGGVRQSEE